jgi:hypothetical protein
MGKYSIVRKADEYTLSEESATEQVVTLLTYYDIDVDKIPDTDAKAGFERALDTVTSFIRRGVLEVITDKDNRVSVIHNLIDGNDKLTYGELGARHKLAMDRVKKGEDYHRMYALMGSLSGIGSGAIEKLKAKDLSVVEVLGTVFLNA